MSSGGSSITFSFILFENLDSMSPHTHRSEQTRIPAHQQTDELCSTCESGESEEDTTVQEGEKAIDHMSLPREKLAQSQKKITHLIKEKMVKQTKNSLGFCFHLKICPYLEKLFLYCRMKHMK